LKRKKGAETPLTTGVPVNVPSKIVSQIAVGESASLVNNTGFGSSASQSRFLRYFLQNAACQLLPESRITACMKLVIPGRNGVEVLYSDERKRARLGNLCACALLWQCPVCASRISEGRSALLLSGMAGAKVNALHIVFTMSHGASQRLAPNLEALLDAYKALTHGSVWTSFEQRYGWLTAIRALEVTHGVNGWHPHLHVLAFLKQPLHYDEAFMFDIQLTDMWRARLATKGASASQEHGIVIGTTEKSAAAYLAKFGREPKIGANGRSAWGIERELTKAVTKNARYNGRTPWALLSDYAHGDQQAGALFVEYVEAFKNKKQLVIPIAARALLSLDDVTDDELTAAPLSAIERLLVRLDIDQWKRILFGDFRQDLIAVANTGSSDQLLAWLERVGVM